MPEIQASIDAGYVNTVQPQQVRQMNVPNLGNILYNTQERVVNLANVKQPFIVPPTSSKAYPNYAKQVTESYGEPMAKKVLGRAFTPEQRAFAEGFSPVKNISTVLEKEYNSHASGLVPNYVSLKELKDLMLKQGSIRKGDNLDKNTNYEVKFDDGTSVIGKPYELESAVLLDKGVAQKNQFSSFFRKDRDPALNKTLNMSKKASMLLPVATEGNTATMVDTKISGEALTETLGRPGALTKIIGPSLGKEKDAKTKLQTALMNDVFHVKFAKSGIQDLENNASLREGIDSDLSTSISNILTNHAKSLVRRAGLKEVNIYNQEVKGQAERLVASNSALTGTMFEDIITIAVGKSNEFSSQDHYRNWDFQNVSSLNELFDRQVNPFADTKRSDLPHARFSMAKKILMGTPEGENILRQAAQQLTPSTRKGAKTAADGFTPKFAVKEKMKAAMAAGNTYRLKRSDLVDDFSGAHNIKNKETTEKYSKSDELAPKLTAKGGLVPNLIGRANKKETSSRIYEATLATGLYNKPVSFGDTRVENIQVASGGMVPVAVNNQETVFKTGKDVQRHFGLKTTPDGGMVLPPADTQVGRQVRSQAAEGMQNAAEGIVPNFVDPKTLAADQASFANIYKKDSTANLPMKVLRDAIEFRSQYRSENPGQDLNYKLSNKTYNKIADYLNTNNLGSSINATIVDDMVNRGVISTTDKRYIKVLQLICLLVVKELLK